jgi:hypothetical protein
MHAPQMTEAAVDVAQLSINTIRTLSIDAAQQARSGHPVTPMAPAPRVIGVETFSVSAPLKEWAGGEE